MKFKTIHPNFIGFLPDEKNYRRGEVRQSGYLFPDKDVPMVSIISPTSTPFNQEWGISLIFQFGKSDKTKYPIGFRLKLFPVEEFDGYETRILREIYKSKIPFVGCEDLEENVIGASFSPPIPGSSNMWIRYTFLIK